MKDNLYGFNFNNALSENSTRLKALAVRVRGLS